MPRAPRLGQPRLAPEAEVFTDGLWTFRHFADAGHPHTVLCCRGWREP